jgi:hypothetical protein
MTVDFSSVSKIGSTKREWSQMQWIMAVILTTWEAEIRRIFVRDQPGQTVSETPFQ